MTVLCATTNPGKLREFRLAAKAAGIDVEPLASLGALDPPDETGDTFEANAILKAEYYSRGVAGLLFAEDSGLEVDLLDGEPGVRSARYAGEHATDAQNNALVAERLAGRDSAARYVCVIALARDGKVVRTFPGVVEGLLIPEQRGAGGFGYDPMFFYPPFGATFGEASAEQKMQVSHRAAALRKLFSHIASNAEIQSWSSRR